MCFYDYINIRNNKTARQIQNNFNKSKNNTISNAEITARNWCNTCKNLQDCKKQLKAKFA